MIHNDLSEQSCKDAEQTSAIHLSGVEKHFINGDHTIEVLKNVNLTVPPQAIVALIGHPARAKARC